MTQKRKPHAVPSGKLRWRCDLDCIDTDTVEDTRECPDIIGQKRAVNALRMAFDIESHGYNIFVNGLVGTGRKTAVRCLIQESKRVRQIPDDKLYVNNFKNSDNPRLIRLPAGKGREFKKDMREFIDYLTHTMPAIFESDEYQTRKKKVVDGVKKKQAGLIQSFEKEVKAEKFAVLQIQVGTMTRPVILPVIDDKPVNFDQIQEFVDKGVLTKKQVEALEKKHVELTDKMNAVMKQMRDLEKGGVTQLKALDREMFTPLVELRINEIKEEYDSPRVTEYLEEVEENVLDNLNTFLKSNEDAPPSPFMGMARKENEPFAEYQVNLLVDNCGAKGAPVIFETSPSYNNLFGTVEVTSNRMGAMKTDFTKIKAGSLLQADGGFLIVEALDLLIEPGVWPAFKRSLRNQKVEIQMYTPMYTISLSGMKPESIEINVKVAIVGDSLLYHLLYTRDEDFKKIFKLRADFDSVTPLGSDSMSDYTRFITRIKNNEKLLPFDREAYGAVLEYGVKLAGKQDRLSTQFNKVADILREANYWAREKGRSRVGKRDVETAIEEKMDRSRLIEEKIQEMIEEGSIMIDTEGAEVGQVNGLSVYDMGDYAFGRPSRITANVSVGGSGIINIEREAELSGRIHDKGVLILAGYLRDKYAQDKPLTVSASLCFEQSYAGVEGDSASSTEMYALLSALSGLPLRQDIAVTGSVNQKGEIQPIGGVNEKIEGFFRVCRARGLTGDQGVIIPHQNVRNLMLHAEVVEAVESGTFHIHAIETVDEGIEILTGVEAGSRQPDGSYGPETVNGRADARLRGYAAIWRNFTVGAKP